MKKAILFLLFVIPVVGGLYWLLQDLVDGTQPKTSIDISPPDRRQHTKPPASVPPKAETPPQINREAAIRPTTPSPSKAPVMVNSYDPILAYRVDLWTTQNNATGHIDNMRIDGSPPMPANSRRLRSGDVLSLSGWAGHPRFGMRMRNVLFTLCELVIGTAEVSNDRPDVARVVHPNLGRSGWSAQLAVSHFPDCENPTLGAWAVGPTGTLVWPLIGAMPVRLPAPPRRPMEHFVSMISPVTPEDADPLRLWTFGIQAPMVNLRQCGSTKCPIVGKIPAGTYKAFFTERAGNWVLLQFSDATGWVAKRLLTIQKDEAVTP